MDGQRTREPSRRGPPSPYVPHFPRIRDFPGRRAVVTLCAAPERRRDEEGDPLKPRRLRASVQTSCECVDGVETVTIFTTYKHDPPTAWKRITRQRHRGWGWKVGRPDEAAAAAAARSAVPATTEPLGMGTAARPIEASRTLVYADGELRASVPPSRRFFLPVSSTRGEIARQLPASLRLGHSFVASRVVVYVHVALPGHASTPPIAPHHRDKNVSDARLRRRGFSWEQTSRLRSNGLDGATGCRAAHDLNWA